MTVRQSYVLSVLGGSWDRILLLSLCEAVGEMRLRKSLYGHCIEQGDDTLLKQWHPTKNVSLTPRDVTSGSRQKVWWLCEKGHEWQAAVYTRTGGGSGCPYCAGKRAYPGENDLTSQYPDIAAQWHPTQNGRVTPDSVTTGSHREV